MIRLLRFFGLLIPLIMISPFWGSCQENTETILKNYIEEGLRNNLTLKQKDFSFKKSLQLVRQAKSLFYPSVTLESRYTIARGGRTEIIPVGDLINPVYQSLNALLDAAENIPGPIDLPDTRFPTQVPNDAINFLRETDQETKFRLYQPVFQPEILIRKKIAENLTDIRTSETEVFKRELIAQIKTSYYQYLITSELHSIILDGLSLVDQHLLQAEKLVQLKKSTTYPVYRIKAEKSDLEADLAEIEGNMAIARSYFNFLLNRPLDDEIKIAETLEHTFEEVAEFEAYLENAINSRQELTQIDLGLELAEKQRKLTISQKWPTLVAVVDYGIQGEQYAFGPEDDFFAGSLVFRWDIFSGFRQNAKVQEAAIEMESLKVQKEEAVNQVKLEVIKQFNNLKASRKRLDAAKSKVISAKRSFELVEALYKNQKATLLDWLDGRTLLTSSRKEVVIKEYEYLILWADFQRIIGL